MTVIDVIFYGESQFKFELNVMSFICLLGTVFLQHLRAELIMGPKFCLYFRSLPLRSYGIPSSIAGSTAGWRAGWIWFA